MSSYGLSEQALLQTRHPEADKRRASPGTCAGRAARAGARRAREAEGVSPVWFIHLLQLLYCAIMIYVSTIVYRITSVVSLTLSVLSMVLSRLRTTQTSQCPLPREVRPETAAQSSEHSVPQS